MTGIGLSNRLDDGRPLIVGVVATTHNDQVEAHAFFRHLANPQEAFPAQLLAIARDLESAWPAEPIDVAVVRSMDWSRVAPKRPVLHTRFCTEGVLLVVTQRLARQAGSFSGVEIARKCSRSKAEIEAEASELVGAAAAEACAAALAAVAIAGGR